MIIIIFHDCFHVSVEATSIEYTDYSYDGWLDGHMKQDFRWILFTEGSRNDSLPSFPSPPPHLLILHQ